MRHCRSCVWCWLRYAWYVELFPSLYREYSDVICLRCRERDLEEALDYLLRRVGEMPNRLLYLGDDQE